MHIEEACLSCPGFPSATKILSQITQSCADCFCGLLDHITEEQIHAMDPFYILAYIWIYVYSLYIDNKIRYWTVHICPMPLWFKLLKFSFLFPTSLHNCLLTLRYGDRLHTRWSCHVCVTMLWGCLWRSEEGLGAREVELEVVLSYQTLLLGTELGFFLSANT